MPAHRRMQEWHSAGLVCGLRAMMTQSPNGLVPSELDQLLAHHNGC